MAETPDLVRNPFAANGDKGPGIEQSAADGMVNFNDGYTTAYEMALDKGNPLARPVTRQVQNYLFNQMSQTTKAWQQMTFAPWYAGMPNGYEVGAHVYAPDAANNRALFVNTAANNVSEPKSLNGWQVVPLPSAMWANIPLPSGGGIGRSHVLAAAVDLRSLTRGTYVVPNDTMATQCQNIPSRPGQAAISGMYEVMGPTTSNNVYEARFLDRLGNVFTCGSIGGTWSTWEQSLTFSDYQRGAALMAGNMSGSAAAAQIATVPPFTPVNGSIVWCVPNLQLVAGATLAVNGTVARPVLGADMNTIETGSVYPGAHVAFQLDSARNAWVVVNSSSPQIRRAVADAQAPNLGQVKEMIAEIGDVEWANIKNKPRVEIWGDTAHFAITMFTERLALLRPGADPSGGNPAWSIQATTSSGNLLVFTDELGNSRMSMGVVTPGPASGVNRAVTVLDELRVGRGIRVIQANNTAAITFATAALATIWDMRVSDAGLLTFNRANNAHLSLEPGGRVTFRQRPLFNEAIPYDTKNYQTAGMVVPFADKHTQVGWIYCDGRSLPVANYPNLFAVIGYKYGGSGASFNVPDMRGVHPRGLDDGRGIDPGRAINALQQAQVGGHVHSGVISDSGLHSHTINGNINSAGTHTHSASTSIAGAGAHTHSGQTTVNGEHQHHVKEGHNLGVVRPGVPEILASGDDYTTDIAYYSSTLPAGGHYHALNINDSGFHAHTASTGIAAAGFHAHTASTSIANNGDHTHTINLSSLAAGTHSHTINIASNNGAAENRVTNLAMPFYISTGELGIV